MRIAKHSWMAISLEASREDRTHHDIHPLFWPDGPTHTSPGQHPRSTAQVNKSPVGATTRTFLGHNDPYKALNTALTAEINDEVGESLNINTSRPYNKPESGRIAVKVINHLGNEVMKVFRV